MIRKVSTINAPPAVGPYSQAIIAGQMVYTSGQIPLLPESSTVIEGDIALQTEQVLKNLQAVLEAAGASLDTVVKTTCFLVDMKDFSTFNEVYSKYLPGLPARSCVAVRELPKGVRVEIEAIAQLV